MHTHGTSQTVRRPCKHGPQQPTSRREFLQQAATLAGAACLAPSLASALETPTRTATDQVPLGKTGLVLSRLGFGAGSNSGNVQKQLGQRTFNDLIHYAFERGLTYIDCAETYATFEWIGQAIKGLPRKRSSFNRRSLANPRTCSRPSTSIARSTTPTTSTAC